MTVERGGVKFSGYNKPKRTPNHPTKSHAVLDVNHLKHVMLKIYLKARCQQLIGLTK